MGLLSAGAFIRWGFCPPGLLSAGAFIRWGIYPLGLLSVGLFRWGFCPWGFCPRGFCPTLNLIRSSSSMGLSQVGHGLSESMRHLFLSLL